MKRVYVAGKLNADAVGYIENMHQMIKAADAIRKKGFSVFVPCLDFVCGLVIGGYEYDDYFDNNQEFLRVCDAMMVIPDSECSKGTQREIDYAKHLGIPVFFNVMDLLTWKTNNEQHQVETVEPTQSEIHTVAKVIEKLESLLEFVKRVKELQSKGIEKLLRDIQ